MTSPDELPEIRKYLEDVIDGLVDGLASREDIADLWAGVAQVTAENSKQQNWLKGFIYMRISNFAEGQANRLIDD